MKLKLSGAARWLIRALPKALALIALAQQAAQIVDKAPPKADSDTEDGA